MKSKILSFSKYLAVLFVIPLIFCFTACGNKNNYSVEYASIEDKGTYFYLVIDIKRNFEKNCYVDILSRDFAVKKDGLPISAKYIAKVDSNSFAFKLSTDEDMSILVSFELSIEELDKPVTFYYQGKELKLGEKIVIEN